MGDINYFGEIDKTVEIKLKLKLSSNDLYNWATNCYDLETLKYILRAIKSQIRSIENPQEVDDFRSLA